MAFMASVFVLFMLCGIGVVEAFSDIRIVNPHELAANFSSGLSHKNALFGLPPYRQTLTGRIIYATPGDRDGCLPINKSLSSQPWPSDESLIVMLDRGDCDFVLKVQHAQESGAIAAIVVDNRPQAQNLPWMADNGKGHLVSIPSVIIHYNDGRAIENFINANLDAAVVIEMQWREPRSDNKVIFSFWSSSLDPNSVQLKKDFHEAIDALRDSIVFEPKFFFYDGIKIGCHPDVTWCAHYCTNHGRYCAGESPDHAVKGRKIVEENLRQACVWRVVNQTDTHEARIKWWDYVAKFIDDCSTDPVLWGTDCVTKTLNAVQIPVDEVNQCMTDSGGLIDDAPNTIIDAFLAERSDMGIYWLPTVFINNDRFIGSWQCASPIDIAHCSLLAGICDGFQPENLPSACRTSAGCTLGSQRDACGICGGHGIIDVCGECHEITSPAFNKSCAGCDGVPNSGQVRDVCGVCDGHGRVDACGVCVDARSGAFNKSCAGCDGVPNSGVTKDVCGQCGGTETEINHCSSVLAGASKHKGISIGVVVGVIAAFATVGGGFACVHVRRQNRRMNDIKEILKAYQPLEETHGMPSSDHGDIENDESDSFLQRN